MEEARWRNRVLRLSLTACFLVARRLTSASWPLQQAEVDFVFVAGAAYLASFGFRALGWQRVFPSRQRPDCARCLAACGVSAASGTVLPFRLDYLVKISLLRQLRGITLGLDTIVLSIVTLGMVDAVAMLPLAIVAVATSGALFLAPLTVVILFCLSCIGILIADRGSCACRCCAVGGSRRGSVGASAKARPSHARRS